MSGADRFTNPWVLGSMPGGPLSEKHLRETRLPFDPRKELAERHGYPLQGAKPYQAAERKATATTTVASAGFVLEMERQVAELRALVEHLDGARLGCLAREIGELRQEVERLKMDRAQDSTVTLEAITCRVELLRRVSDVLGGILQGGSVTVAEVAAVNDALRAAIDLPALPPIRLAPHWGVIATPRAEELRS